MIVRNVAVRSGRAAATSFAAASRQRLRTYSTEPPSIPESSSLQAPPLIDVVTAPPENSAEPAQKLVKGGRTVAVPRVADPKLQARFGEAKTAKQADMTAHMYDVTRRFKRHVQKMVDPERERSYTPGDLLQNPPKPKDVTLELLMASQCHIGHHTGSWNPANARYIYGVREGVHIISLEQTAAHLRRAARVVEEVAYCGGLILFVGTRPGQMDIVTRAAELGGGYHLFTKWTPGTITNRDVIMADGQLKMVDEHDKTLPGFDEHLRSRRPVVPDLVVCMNPLENYTLLHECVVAKIPSIGVVDTNGDPTKLTYTIPANDDSLRSIGVICGVLGRAAELGQRRRLAAAKAGVVEWENAADVARFIAKENEAKDEKAQAEMTMEQQIEADLLAAEEVKRLLI